jgi:DNA repair protein RecO (recombination protein O)
MEERSSGIILRTRPLTETSLIVQWITPELGRISTVAKGARRPKSPFRGKLDLFFEAEFSFVRSRRSELHNLREVSTGDLHAELRSELGWLHQASYFAVLIEKSTEAETPIPEVYELMRSALGALPRANLGASMIFAFELKLLSLLGYEPDLAGVSPGTRELGRELINRSFEGEKVQTEARAQNEINQLLRVSIGTVLGKIPSQRERALERMIR